MTQTDRTDFVTLKRARTPNTFLIAPEGLCKNAKIDLAAPVYGVSAEKLRQELLRIAIAKPRVSHKLKDDAGLYDDLVVRSALFKFPDLISMQFIGEKGGKSTLAIYSRSVYGRSDLGVNRQRTLGWLRELEQVFRPISS